MSSHIRNIGRNAHKAYLRSKITKIEEEQAMAQRTTTDEVIDVVVDTAREGIASLASWGKRVRSSLESYIEEEQATERRSKFTVIDGERPKLYDGDLELAPLSTASLSVHHPTVTVVRPVTASSLAEARDKMEQELADLGYSIVRHPSVR